MKNIAHGKRFTFSKSERLKSKKKIEELFKNGSSFHLYPFLVRFLPQKESTVNEVLISVPVKYQKLAVKRNLIKRRMREAYRLNKHILSETNSGGFLLAFIYLSNDILAFKEIEKKLTLVLNRLSKEAQVA